MMSINANARAGALIVILLAITGLTAAPAFGQAMESSQMKMAVAPDLKGVLLSNPDMPSSGYYWRLNDNHKVYYNSVLGTQTSEGPIAFLAGAGGGSGCTSADLAAGGCAASDGVCVWDTTTGREWYEADAQGNYHPGDFVFGRCAAVRIWSEDGVVKAIGRAGMRTTAVVGDAGCVGCEASVQGTWNFSLTIQWLDAVGNPASDVASPIKRADSCHVKSQLLGNAAYGDCRWGALGNTDIAQSAPSGAAGFRVFVRLIDDFQTRELAQVDCPGCLTVAPAPTSSPSPGPGAISMQ